MGGWALGWPEATDHTLPKVFPVTPTAPHHPSPAPHHPLTPFSSLQLPIPSPIRLSSPFPHYPSQNLFCSSLFPLLLSHCPSPPLTNITTSLIPLHATSRDQPAIYYPINPFFFFNFIPVTPSTSLSLPFSPVPVLTVFQHPPSRPSSSPCIPSPPPTPSHPYLMAPL